MNIISRYVHWLHTRWPAGTVEKLPRVDEQGRTSVPGIRIVGDLTGIPLLKFAADTGARAITGICSEPDFKKAKGSTALDVAIVGAGPAGLSAALEAKRLGLKFEIFEASEPLSTIVNFPRAKPIYVYPTEMDPAGSLKLTADVKEDLIAELEQQREDAGIQPQSVRIHKVTRKGGHLHLEDEQGIVLATSLRVVLAVGRSGNFRSLGVPGEHSDNVYNRLHDPADFTGFRALVVGGGDSALETVIALVCSGAHVTLAYRNREFSRPKPENIQQLEALQRNAQADVGVEHPSSERVTTAVTAATRRGWTRGSLSVHMNTELVSIEPGQVQLKNGLATTKTVENDVVFAMVGREPPLDFFRRCGIALSGEMRLSAWVTMGLFALFCGWLYNWKSGGHFDQLWRDQTWFPYTLEALVAQAGLVSSDLGTIILKSASGPAFWYTLAYSIVVVVFGIRRIRRRRTPYVKWQTLALMSVQLFPLFILPEILLPWLDGQGWLPRFIADPLFPEVTYGHGREFWRAYGLILAWPLNVYNIFTAEPLWAWIGIGFVQTFLIIPLGIYRWGKGFYCGWICTCGALAETLGDTHRHKMPHGPVWNRANLVGQLILGVAVVMLVLRIAGWIVPGYDIIDEHFFGWLDHYKWMVDVGLAGIVGYAVYFWYSGRVWCRFACPLAALMHIYTRFSRFRIFAEKPKCISCNVCTSVCHQGIDVMNFANKGLEMEDPECVRCSACVQSCPTGVLTFGRLDAQDRPVYDRLAASAVQLREHQQPPASGEVIVK